MKIKIVTLLLIALVFVSFNTQTESKKYKCMVQLTNYSGEGAYIVISLINPKGGYEKTLNVQGNDPEWFHTVTEWWKFHGKKRSNIDAITGATISGGERSIIIIEIEDSKIDAGYSIRFETAVEDQQYHTKDVEFELTSANVNSKKEGKGYIRYVRILPN